MDNKFEKLSELGAGDFEHLDGNLIDHLMGTMALLKSWSASSALQNAGLYHASYGTAGFDERLVSTEQRGKIANIIGEDAEGIVYTYCACDRDYYWPQIGINDVPEFRDRFTGETYPLSVNQLKLFCELTVANELEIAVDNPNFVKKYGAELYSVFSNMHPYLTVQAYTNVQEVLGG